MDGLDELVVNGGYDDAEEHIVEDVSDVETPLMKFVALSVIVVIPKLVLYGWKGKGLRLATIVVVAIAIVMTTLIEVATCNCDYRDPW
ncbi:hypothetical protein VNO78_14687 [Psophocarpus tetragonolobus]|uniref:Uncharacterized protein n=1 Tax=Psophocarpus tetragonolobus TaxID=3891 RepID=A0AAN9XIH7_PSOTE